MYKCFFLLQILNNQRSCKRNHKWETAFFCKCVSSDDRLKSELVLNVLSMWAVLVHILPIFQYFAEPEHKISEYPSPFIISSRHNLWKLNGASASRWSEWKVQWGSGRSYDPLTRPHGRAKHHASHYTAIHHCTPITAAVVSTWQLTYTTPPHTTPHQYPHLVPHCKVNKFLCSSAYEWIYMCVTCDIRKKWLVKYILLHKWSLCLRIQFKYKWWINLNYMTNNSVEIKLNRKTII